MSDIKSTFMNLTNNIAKTSGDFVKNTKLSIELSSEEENLKQVYIEIGKKVHEIYMFGGSLGQFFDEKYKDIIVYESKINDLRNNIDNVKGVRPCEKCGKNVARTMEFCPNCGAKMFVSSEMTVEQTRVPEAAVQLQAPILPPEPANKEEIKPEHAQPVTVEATQLPSQKICAACGAKNALNTRFCLGCGRLI